MYLPGTQIIGQSLSCEQCLVLSLIIQSLKGKSERMLDHDAFLIFKEDSYPTSYRAGSSIHKDGPLVLFPAGGL